MQRVDLKIKGDAAWPELNPETSKFPELVELQSDHLQVAFLDKGTVGGQPVVLIRSDQDGKAYVLQLTQASFEGIMAAWNGKYNK